MVDDLRNLGPSLARRLMLALTAVVAGVTLLAGGWFYFDAVGRAKAGVEEKARQTAVYLQGALRLPLWGIDDAAVKMIGKTLMEDRAFNSVTIRDSEGAIIYSKQLDQDPKALTRLVAVEHRGEEIGTVELSLSARAMRAQAENLLWASGATLFAVLLTITLGSVFLIRLFLKRPIEQLIGVARSFGSVRETGAMPKSYREFQPLLFVLGGLESRINRQIAQLAESEEKFRTLVEGAESMILLLSPEGRILEINPYAERVLGCAREEALGKDYFETFLPEEIRQAVRGDIAEVLLGEVSLDFENPVLGLDGRRHVFLWNASRLLDEAGEPYGVLSIGHDITEKEELERMQSEFIATAAHELRTPLTSVKGFAELLLTRESLDEVSRGKYLAIIHDKAMVLERIIDDLFNLSRVESGRLIRLEKEPCDLKELLQRAVDSYSREFSGHLFEANLPGEAMPLFADPYKIGQVLENLLSNAVKFSAEGCPIEVGGEVRGGEARISVRDKGIGMTPEQAKRIFDKFFRVDASNTGKEGLGLGMSIARAIVEAHGGRIWVESAAGDGTTIAFTIPLGEEGSDS